MVDSGYPFQKFNIVVAPPAFALTDAFCRLYCLELCEVGLHWLLATSSCNVL